MGGGEVACSRSSSLADNIKRLNVSPNINLAVAASSGLIKDKDHGK